METNTNPTPGAVTGEKNTKDADKMAKALEKLQADHAKLNDENAKLKAQVRDSSAQIKRMAADQKAAGIAVKPTTPFEYEGQKYLPLLPKMNIPGIGVVTADELALRADAQRYLVESNSGAIRHIL